MIDKKDKNEKIMIIDGNSILFRAFYAMPPLKTKKGQYTNAVYGFLNMLYKLMDDYLPEYICVAFDPKKPTFRHQQYKDYKAGRAKAPDELVSQFDLIRSVLEEHKIKYVEIDGFEADDIAGTMAKQFSNNGIGAYLVTSDRDYLQLVDDDVVVLLTKKGVTNIKEMNREAIMEDYEIRPEEFVDLKALMGDQSDNIPGVNGVGEKTAIKLIKEYHNLDNLYEHIDEIKGKLKEKLENDKMQAYMSKTLAQIITDIPVEIDIEEYRVQKADDDKLLSLYEELEFKNFKKRVISSDKNNLKEISSTNDSSSDFMQVSFLDMPTQDNSFEIDNSIKLDNLIKFIPYESKCEFEKTIDDLIEKIEQNKEFTFKFIYDKERALFSKVVAIGLFIQNEYYYMLINDECENIIFDKFKNIFEDENIKKSGHSLKAEYIYLMKNGIDLNGVVFDSEIGGYIIEPSDNSYDIDKLCYEYLNLDIMSEKDYLGTGKSKISFRDLDNNKLEQYIKNYLMTIVCIKDKMIEKISELGMDNLFYNIELPLIKVLAYMEVEGFKIDENVLDKLGEKFNQKLLEIENSIYELSNEKFNINSPKQLGVVLFEKLGLEVVKKTKTGYSTDIEVLEKIKDKHPVVEKIIEYRQLSKLNSTYIDGLKAEINHADGRVHSILNQTITATGRISSTEPNLQNIPTRTEEGKEIRKAFVAEDEYVLVDADYSQIELRVLAELSNEEKLIEAFANHEDIHSKTASEVFKVDIKDVTPLMRSRAKAVNFGIIYGISDFGLSRDLDIPRKEAKEYIENYLSYYDKIEKYMDDIIALGKKNLYVETYFGRRRNIPELESRNFNIRSFGERVALNTPVQGTAADIIKIAMINVYKKLKENNMKSRLILQVHDELIIETHKDELEYVKELLKKEMESVTPSFRVKLDVDINVGDSWYESK